MSDELKWLLKEGLGVFLRFVKFLSKICPPHTQLVQFYLHTDAVPFCPALAYAVTPCCFFSASCASYAYCDINR